MTRRDRDRWLERRLEESTPVWLGYAMLGITAATAIGALVAPLLDHLDGELLIGVAAVELDAGVVALATLFLMVLCRDAMTVIRALAGVALALVLIAADVVTFETNIWEPLFGAIVAFPFVWTLAFHDSLIAHSERARGGRVAFVFAKLTYAYGSVLGKLGGPIIGVSTRIGAGAGAALATWLILLLTGPVALAYGADLFVGHFVHPRLNRGQAVSANGVAASSGGSVADKGEKHPQPPITTTRKKNTITSETATVPTTQVHTVTFPTTTVTVTIATTTVPSSDGLISWKQACGPDATLPGYEEPLAIARKFQHLFFGRGQPGGGDSGAGCTEDVHPVPGHPDMLYLKGLSSYGVELSVAVVWRKLDGTLGGALVLAPATEAYWLLVLKYGPVKASERIDTLDGDFYVFWTADGTTVAMRSEKKDGTYAKQYVALGPAAADYWERAIEEHGWLWAVQTQDGLVKEYQFVLATPPGTPVEVVDITPDQKTGRQLSLKTIKSIAPPKN
jgi:hypothetical protein